MVSVSTFKRRVGIVAVASALLATAHDMMNPLTPQLDRPSESDRLRFSAEWHGLGPFRIGTRGTCT